MHLISRPLLLSQITEVVSSLEKDFAGAYQDHYGYRPEGAAIEVETLRVIATSGETHSGEAAPPQTTRSLESSERRSVYLNGEWQPVPVFLRQDLRPGDHFSGPALVFESHCASVVAPGWTGEVDGHRCLVLCRRRAGAGVGEMHEP